MVKGNPPARKPGKGGDRYSRYVVIGIVSVIVLIALTLWGPLKRFRTSGRPPASPAKRAERAVQPPEIGPHVPSAKGRSKAVMIALVIDDLGGDLKPARDLISLKSPITFAVMPGLTQSRKISELAKQNSMEVLLHLPMESKNMNGKQPYGVLRSDMTPIEFMDTIANDLESVPGVAGVNNHEGSALTENSEAMKFLMAELKSRNLFFLDSMTNPKSVALTTAREFGLRSARRDVFLDGMDHDPKYVKKQLDELARIARKQGRAVGIGHPHPGTIDEIRKWMAEIKGQEIEIVPVSKVMQ